MKSKKRHIALIAAAVMLLTVVPVSYTHLDVYKRQFPSQIESVVMGMKEVEPFYEIVLTSEGYMDRIEVKVEFSDASLLDDFTKLEALRAKIKHNLRVILNIDAKVTLVSPGTLPRFEGKGRRVIDHRKNK